MTGGAGLSAGISQGLDKVADGLVKRQQIQQQSAMFNQQMQFNQINQGMKMQQHQTQQEQSKLMIDTMQAKLGEYESQIAKRDAFDAMRAFEYTGDASLLNSANKNPKIKALLASKGIAKFHNLDYMGADKLNEFGITEDMRKDPAKRLVLVTTVDGDTKVMDAMAMYATTGFLNEIGDIKTKEIENSYKQKQMALNLAATSANIENARTTTAINRNKLVESNIALGSMIEWLEANPDKTYQDYQMSAKQTGSYAPSNYEKDLALLARRFKDGEITEEEYDVGVDNIDAKYQGMTPTAGQKESKEKVTNFESFKEQTGAKENWDIDINKLAPKDKTKLQLMAQKEKKDIKDDIADQLPVLSTAASKLNVKDLANTTGIVDATVMESMDRLGIDLGSDVYVQSSNYNTIKNGLLKAAYGSQISQADRDSITDQLGSVYRSDVGVRTKLVQNLDTTIAKYESYKNTHPAYFAVNMREPLETLKQIRNSFDVDVKGAPTSLPVNEAGKVIKSQLKVGQVYTSPDGSESMVWTGKGWASPSKGD